MKARRMFFDLLLALLGVISLTWAVSIPSGSDSVALQVRHLRGANLCLVTADLNDPAIRVDIGIAEKGIAHSEPFYRMVARRSPIAAVTGTYFCTRTLIPVGTIVAGGRKLLENAIGTGVGFYAGNRVSFIASAKGQACDFTGAECALRAGPRLLAGGQYALNPRREGFRHPGLFGRHARMALGLTAHNKLLLVAIRTPVTFGGAASIMKALGAVEAICLDGGSSSAMFYGGRLVCRPGRALTNVIEIHRVAARNLPLPSREPNLSVLSLSKDEGRVGVRGGPDLGGPVLVAGQGPASPEAAIGQASELLPIFEQDWEHYGLLPDIAAASGKTRESVLAPIRS